MFQALTTCDILPADVVALREGNAKLDKLAQQYQLQPGGKKALDEKKFNEFAVQFLDAVQGRAVTAVPGGSAANTTTTINKLLGNLIDISFIGVTGPGNYNDVIRSWLKQADICKNLQGANVRLVPELPPSALAQSAVSFVILESDGERSIVTYPGNAKKLLTADILPKILGHQEDEALFLQGSARRKFGADFTDKLLEWRWGDRPQNRKKLILALPTHALTGDEKEYFQWLATSADVVLGNREELQELGAKPSDLQGLLRRSSVRDPVAFITDGGEGSMVLRGSDKPIKVDVAPVPQKVNQLGCGDAYSAGVLASAALNLQHPHIPAEVLWAKVGTEIAAATLQIQGGQHPNPLGALQKTALWPHVAEQWKNDGRRGFPSSFAGQQPRVPVFA